MVNSFRLRSTFQHSTEQPASLQQLTASRLSSVRASALDEGYLIALQLPHGHHCDLLASWQPLSQDSAYLVNFVMCLRWDDVVTLAHSLPCL